MKNFVDSGMGSVLCLLVWIPGFIMLWLGKVSVQSLQHWCSLDVVLQIIKSLIKLIVLIAAVSILLVRHRSLRETSKSNYCDVPAAWDSAGHVGPTTRIKIGWITPFGGHAAASIQRQSESLTPLISWSRQSCWSGAHYHGSSLITTSVNGDVVCSVSWIRTVDTLNTRFANCLYCKIIVVIDVVWKYFME